MALLLATQNMKMIDKLSFFICCVSLVITIVTTAPTLEVAGNLSTSTDANSTERIPNLLFDESVSEDNQKSSSLSTLPMTTKQSKTLVAEMVSASLVASKGRLQATPPTPMKSRKNKNDLFFCCSDDKLESATQPLKRSKERERNTKAPVLKKGKTPESEEPFFERRPALLLRFFPDGTAVLISKFQLHLHVKPKQIKLDSDEDDTKLDEPLDYNPSVILNDGKSFEVTYKRLEAIPSSREQNLDELSNENLNDSSDNYSEEKTDHQDHELVTPSEITPLDAEAKNKNGRPEPIQESTTSMETTAITSSPIKTEINSADEIEIKRIEKITPTVGDSPFFIMTSGEMSSLQQQYDPVQASPLKGTTNVQLEKQQATSPTPSSTTTQTTPTTTITQTTTQPTMQPTTQTETTVSLKTEPTTTTTKCLSFKNQLSLALSTEDNIDNSLLKKQILPTEDCDTSDVDDLQPFARLQSLETTVTDIPTTTQLTTVTTTTTQSPTTSNAKNNLLPYLSSRLSNDPSKPDVVVVTSLPVIIDLKNSRNKPVTDVPAWREVTVGVVRDQQGHPLKPRYNNWTAHLRGLKIKPENKFWNELTTPRPDMKHPQRLPAQQQFQQSPSQVNNAFWTDLQRQRPPAVPHAREKTALNSQPYLTNPPRSYSAPKANEFQVWRSQPYESNNRRNVNTNNAFYAADDIHRTKGPMRNPQRNFERDESHHQQQWNHGNQRQLPRRW